MIDLAKHLIYPQETTLVALNRINQLKELMVLFVIDENGRLIGSLTDGDIRRSLVQNPSLDRPIENIMNREFRYIYEDDHSVYDLSKFKRDVIALVPLINKERKIIDVINIRTQRSRLPLNAVIMAGGEGKRLLPLTEKTPKPLLKIGGKYIIQYNMEHLARYGVKKLLSLFAI